LLTQHPETGLTGTHTDAPNRHNNNGGCVNVTSARNALSDCDATCPAIAARGFDVLRVVTNDDNRKRDQSKDLSAQPTWEQTHDFTCGALFFTENVTFSYHANHRERCH